MLTRAYSEKHYTKKPKKCAITVSWKRKEVGETPGLLFFLGSGIEKSGGWVSGEFKSKRGGDGWPMSRTLCQLKRLIREDLERSTAKTAEKAELNLANPVAGKET